MDYTCPHCDRAFSCELQLSFCPFCGAAYARPAGNTMVPNRIVIGSDSERTIQEKYWQLTHRKLELVLSLIERDIPGVTTYQPRQIDAAAWLKRQAKCSATEQLAKNCDAFLEQIAAAMKPEACDAALDAGLDVDAAAKKIAGKCAPLLSALTPGDTEKAPPVFSFHTSFSANDRKEVTPVPSDIYALFQTVDAIKLALYTALNQAGIFTAATVFSRLSTLQSDLNDPGMLANQLRDWAGRDYDPLFGEPIDDFVEAFVHAVILMTNAANGAHPWVEYDKNERAKFRALDDYFSSWKQLLIETLDRLYQSQSADMMSVQRDVQQAGLKYCEQEETGHQETEKEGKPWRTSATLTFSFGGKGET